MLAATGGVRNAGVEALVWGGAGSHQAGELEDLGLPRIALPPYSPEANPAERVFQELRRAIEGQVYESIEAKVAAVEAVLERWDAGPERIYSLTNWQ